MQPPSVMGAVPLAPALIVEDIAATSAYLARVLRDLCGAGTDIAAATTLADARALLAAQSRPLVLVDVGLPDGNGIELVEWLHRHRPDTVSVVVSAWGDEQTVLTALRAGATGYLFKERDADELRPALKSIQRGGAPIDPFVARHILALVTATPGAGPRPAEFALSVRETEILQRISEGCGMREVADSMQLPRSAIERGTKAIYRKLAVRERAAPTPAARAQGLPH